MITECESLKGFYCGNIQLHVESTTGCQQRVENKENENGHGKVIEIETFFMEFCDQS